MTGSAQAPQRVPTPLPRAPWTLRLAGASWIAAGCALVLTPLIAALMVRSQYLSLRRNGYRLANVAEWLDPTDYVRLEPYFAEFERIESLIFDSASWTVPLAVVVYLMTALTALACYLAISIAAARGVNWTRIVGSILAVVSSYVVLQIWQFFLIFAWMPVTALTANHAGLLVIALQITGIVFAFLPASNAYVKERRDILRLRSGRRLAQ